MNIVTALLTNQGGRNNNQDFAAYCLIKEGGCWVVADGLGGHKGGADASKTAALTLLNSFQKKPLLSQAGISDYIAAAHSTLLQLQDNHTNSAAFRTTITVLTINKGMALWGHIGDSRLYCFQNGTIVDQTKDHSLCQILVNIGEIKFEEIRFHEDRCRLLQALGMEKELKPAIPNKLVNLQPNSAFLLCTDGFWEYVLEEEMESTLLKAGTPQHWLNLMESILLTRVQGRYDNYTAIALFIAEKGDEHVKV